MKILRLPLINQILNCDPKIFVPRKAVASRFKLLNNFNSSYFKKKIFCAPLATAIILGSQSAKADAPYMGGIETVVPFALSENHLVVPLLLGFFTGFVVFLVSSSKKAHNDKNKFLSILITDFWFEGFVTPGIGTILLFILYSTFWGWAYFLIWSSVRGHISFNAFLISLLVGLALYITSRMILESIISITKIAGSVNAILFNLNNENKKSKLDSASILTHPNKPEDFLHLLDYFD